MHFANFAINRVVPVVSPLVGGICIVSHMQQEVAYQTRHWRPTVTTKRRAPIPPPFCEYMTAEWVH